MIFARLTDDNRWVVISSDNSTEFQQIQLSFTKKINDWYIIKKKNKNANVDETFMNAYGMIPVGLWLELVTVCKKYNYNLQFSEDFDSRIRDYNLSKEGFENYIRNLFAESNIQPKSYQIEGAYNALMYKNSCIEVSTSGGKTLISYMIFRYMKDVLHIEHILFITPKTNLTTQSADKFIEYDRDNGILTDWSYGEIHANAKKKEEYNENIVFGNYQSIVRKKDDFFRKFDVVILDECHHGVCNSLKTIMRKCINARYKIGMTGTFPKQDSYDSYVLQSYLGPVVFRLSSYQLINEEKFATPVHVLSVILNYLDDERKDALYKLRQSKDRDDPTAGGKIFEMEKMVCREDKVRFKYVTNLIKSTTKNSLVIFSDIKTEYGHKVFQYLKENTDKNVYYIEGNTATAARDDIKRSMEDDTTGNTIIVASMGCFSEGIDISNLWNIFLIEDTKSDNTLAQILGRGMRRYPGKDKTMLIDIVDDYRWGNDYFSDNYLYRHGAERREIYTRRGFPCFALEVDLTAEYLK